jgi:hypothetical protein
LIRLHEESGVKEWEENIKMYHKKIGFKDVNFKHFERKQNNSLPLRVSKLGTLL